MVAHIWYQQFQLAQPPIDEIRPLLGQDKTTWTQAMTRWTVQTCTQMGWAAVARGHRTPILPIEKSELLSVDVMAFPAGASRWSYPIAAIELENQPRDDYIAYDLWKLLCLRVRLRLVYCYRPLSEQGQQLARFLSQELISPLSPDQRNQIGGETLLVIGRHDQADTFPNRFFQWWALDLELGRFRPFS
jgi:hypothetical protein